MKWFSNYETALWTLIGVISGLLLSFLYRIVEQKKDYKARVQTTIRRLISLMHSSEPKRVIERIADFVPQFKEKEQIRILSEVGQESSLNANTDPITEKILEELRWICLLYESEVNEFHDIIKKGPKDINKVQNIYGVLWGIAYNIVEYRQSEKLLSAVFTILQILEKYSINRSYYNVIASSINLYKETGILSIGADYLVSGYRLLNFQYGINECIKRLNALRESILHSSLEKAEIDDFLKDIGDAVKKIREEYNKRISHNSSDNPNT